MRQNVISKIRIPCFLLVDLYYSPEKKIKKPVFNYYIFNFVNKSSEEICFLSCYMSTYTVSSILSLDPQSLIFTTRPFRERVTSP